MTTIEQGGISCIEVLAANDAPDLYRSRAFWEAQFSAIGLWPEMLAYDRVSREFSQEIDQRFKAFQLVAVASSDPAHVIGVAHAVPLRAGRDLWELPETGWDWALESAVAASRDGTRADALCALSASVLPCHQHRGIGKRLLSEMLVRAAQYGFSRVVAPVRPVSKQGWPAVPMAEFLGRIREDGLHEDPWIRTHQRSGAKLLKVCERSMTVVAPLEQWERWHGAGFPHGGRYLIKGCLAPVSIDLANRVGIYYEPNVWMSYAT